MQLQVGVAPAYLEARTGGALRPRRHKSGKITRVSVYK